MYGCVDEPESSQRRAAERDAEGNDPFPGRDLRLHIVDKIDDERTYCGLSTADHAFGITIRAQAATCPTCLYVAAPGPPPPQMQYTLVAEAPYDEQVAIRGYALIAATALLHTQFEMGYARFPDLVEMARQFEPYLRGES